MFNTLKYVKILQGVGVSKEQSEAHVDILLEIMEEKIATKEDLRVLKTDLKLLKAELTSELTVRMGTMLAAAVGILAAIIKLF